MAFCMVCFFAVKQQDFAQVKQAVMTAELRSRYE